MTGPAPASGARERLAAVLTDDVLVPIERGPVLDALLPVVESLADERAAEALEQAAGTAPVMRFDNGYPVRAVPISDLLSFAAVLRAASSRGETGQ